MVGATTLADPERKIMSSEAKVAWRRWLVAGLATATVLAAAACGSGSGKSSTGDTLTGGEVDREAHLRVAYNVTTSLDPHKAPEPGGLIIATWPVYDRLIQVGPDSQYEPMLATDWKFSANGKQLVLTLREGVTFSDGVSFDAEAVKANLEDFMKADGTALQTNVADIESVEVLEPTKVQINLKRPTTAILSSLASTMGGAMISPKALKSGNLGKKPVGTGAYVIEEFRPGQSVTYSRRTDKGGIWDDKTGKAAKVTITSLVDSQAKANALSTDQIDLTTWSGEAKSIQSQLDAGKLQHVVSNYPLITGLYFNTKVKPFDDLAVRRAFNYAIDRKGITEAFMPDGKPRVQPWPEGLSGYDPETEKAYLYDPEKAKDLLKDAGYENGVDAGEIVVAQASGMSGAAEAIQANLADVGIKVTIRMAEIFSIVTDWPKGKMGSMFFYVALPSIDVSQFVDRVFVNPYWRPDGGDAKIAAMSQGLGDPALSDEDREASVKKIVKYATDQGLYASVWQGGSSLVGTSKVRGLDNIASINGAVPDLRNTYLVK